MITRNHGLLRHNPDGHLPRSNPLKSRIKIIFLIRVATSAERYCIEEQKWWSQPASYSKLSPGGPIPHNLARALMPRQPYSVAVPSTE